MISSIPWDLLSLTIKAVPSSLQFLRLFKVLFFLPPNIPVSYLRASSSQIFRMIKIVRLLRVLKIDALKDKVRVRMTEGAADLN